MSRIHHNHLRLQKCAHNSTMSLSKASFQSWHPKVGRQTRAETTKMKSWLFWFGISPPRWRTALLLLNMYGSYWSWRSHYTSMQQQIGDSGDPHLPPFFFFYLKPVCFLMYLSAQLVQIASSITGSRYENVDPPAPRAQTYCYECNLKASCGRSSSRFLCCKGKSGDIRGVLGGVGGGEGEPHYSSLLLGHKRIDRVSLYKLNLSVK